MVVDEETRIAATHSIGVTESLGSSRPIVGSRRSLVKKVILLTRESVVSCCQRFKQRVGYVESYCPFCGRAAEDGWVYCFGCGKPLPKRESSCFTEAQPAGPVTPQWTDAPAPALVSPRVPASTQPIGAGFPSAGAVIWSDAKHPWLRQWARLTDNILITFLLAFVATMFGLDITQRPGSIVGGCLAFAIWIPIEALLLSTFGETPGKALFNLKVAVAGGAKPSFSVAINRAMRVWVFGLGLGLPLVSLFTVISAYTRLRDLDATSWDEECGTAVLHRPLGLWRILLIVIAPILIFVLAMIFAASKDSF